MKLYEIDQQIRDILDQIDEDGQLPEAAFDNLTELSAARSVKYEAIACLIKEHAATAKMLNDEAYNLTKRQKAHEKHADNLKAFLADSMIQSGELSLETSKVKVGFRKSVGVVIDDEAKIPEKYLVALAPTISKTAISDDLKAGIIVPGARIEERQNLQVK